MSLNSQFILVMRRAEKPADTADPNLAPAGMERAHTLAKYIPDTFGELDCLLAGRAAACIESIAPQ